MSTIARDLIREAIDLWEDVALATFADKRMKTFDRITTDETSDEP